MEIAVISGKGGTGKSCVSSAFATLSEKVVLADCDVDAANLHILFNPEIEEEQIYIAGQKAIIDYSLCTNCGKCKDYCRFDAISFINQMVSISDINCDGCRLCSRVCPYEAVNMVANDKSRMYSGSFRNGKIVYGRLSPGEENSGKLVNKVRDKAKEICKLSQFNTIIIDGPPGIGCPVISTITGVNHVVIVTEPSISGIHDLMRTIEITSKFNLKTWVIINKYDINEDMTNRIVDYCNDLNIKVIGKFLFDSEVVDATVNCKSIIEWSPQSDFSEGIRNAYKRITDGQ